MLIYRIPYLLRIQEHLVTGVLLEHTVETALDNSPDAVEKQLAEYARGMIHDDPWFESNFYVPQLEIVQVSIRPEYRRDNRVWPGRSNMKIPIARVKGELDDGRLVAALPFLDLLFYYHEERDLESMTEHYAKAALQGKSAAQLTPFLTPAEYKLDTVTVRIDDRGGKRARKAVYRDLEKVGEPIGAPAYRKRYPHVWERGELLAQLTQRMQKDRANLLLLGDQGVGKTSLLVHGVRRVERDLPKEQRVTDPHIYWHIKPANIIAGMKYLGQWQERCEALIDQLRDNKGTMVVDDLVGLLTNAGPPESGIAAFLLPYLQRGELNMILEADLEAWEACRRLLPAFANCFQVMRVDPLVGAAADKALQRAAETLASRYKIEIEDDVPTETRSLHRRFLPYCVFPGETVRFLEQCCARVHHASLKGLEDGATRLSVDSMTAMFIEKTGLPEKMVRDSIPLAWEQIKEELAGDLIGQTDAVDAVADVVTAFKAGLNDPNRPLGVLLFCGPTGVGKTELARVLSNTLFGHGKDPDQRLIRLDMSEYGAYGAAERLLGGGDQAEWIRKIREQPFSVVLLDEIEKADPEVFDILLNVLDEGRLTDAFGRRTWFRGAIMIMTSNLGARQHRAAGIVAGQQPTYMTAVKNFFRPEFINRIDRIIPFQPLDAPQIRRICAREMAALTKREGLKQAGITLSWDDGVIDMLSAQGFDARYGARPLQRMLDQTVVTVLARYLVDHPETRDLTLHLEKVGEGLQVAPAKGS